MTKEDLIAFEVRVKEAWERGEIKAPVHFCGGNEDQLIEIFKEIKPNDYVLSSHRNHYHALLHGVQPEAIMAEILGTPSGVCQGRARSMGLICRRNHFYSSAIVGGLCAAAVGVAWALKQELRNNPLNTDEFGTPPRHVWCFVGDGAVDGGHFHEALQYASGWNLPITFVVEDNNRATCTATHERLGSKMLPRIMYSTKLKVYLYEPTYPHVGTGKYVQF